MCGRASGICAARRGGVLDADHAGTAIICEGARAGQRLEVKLARVGHSGSPSSIYHVVDWVIRSSLTRTVLCWTGPLGRDHVHCGQALRREAAHEPQMRGEQRVHRGGHHPLHSIAFGIAGISTWLDIDSKFTARQRAAISRHDFKVADVVWATAGGYHRPEPEVQHQHRGQQSERGAAAGAEGRQGKEFRGAWAHCSVRRCCPALHCLPISQLSCHSALIELLHARFSSHTPS